MVRKNIATTLNENLYKKNKDVGYSIRQKC